MVPAQAPMARARSIGSRKTSLMIDNEAGIVSAAPIPTDRPPRDQESHRTREPGARGCSAEEGQTDEEEAPAAESIGQAASDQQKP